MWNSLKIAFSMYSKIPMPKADWEKEKMRYVMCFFPLVGVVIGILCAGWAVFAGWAGLGELLRTVVLVLIPVFVTGGIHLDGFLDTMDAVSSMQPRERRLEILKDSHAGAFAVISANVLFLLNLGIYSELSERGILLLSVSFPVSRILSGLSVISFPCAKRHDSGRGFDNGLAAGFQEAAQKARCRVILILELAAAAAFAAWLEPMAAVCICLTAAAVMLWYYDMAKKKFGGITGDLAGWFLQVCECAMAASVMIGEKVLF